MHVDVTQYQVFSGMLISQFDCVACDRHMGLQQVSVAPIAVTAGFWVHLVI